MSITNSIIGILAILTCVVVPIAVWLLIYFAPEFFAENWLWKKHDESIDAETKEEAIAIVLEVEDLDVANDVEKKNAKSMRLKFEVIPKIGVPFKSQTYAMIDNESIKKLSVGKNFYIKFDRHNTEKSALIRSFE